MLSVHGEKLDGYKIGTDVENTQFYWSFQRLYRWERPAQLLEQAPSPSLEDL
jgi:hypothetical protein